MLSASVGLAITSSTHTSWLHALQPADDLADGHILYLQLLCRQRLCQICEVLSSQPAFGISA